MISQGLLSAIAPILTLRQMPKTTLAPMAHGFLQTTMLPDMLFYIFMVAACVLAQSKLTLIWFLKSLINAKCGCSFCDII